LTYRFDFDLKEVKRYYSEFEGEDLWEEELATDEPFYVKFYKPMPVTFGFEIEQYDNDICEHLQRAYSWHYDGSGPLETAIGPATYPGRLVRRFIDVVKSYDCVWNWKHELPYTGRGCGSHIHFRPRDTIEYIYAQWLEAWTTAYNTMVEVVPFLLPLFAWGTRDKLFFRREGPRWAVLKKNRLSPATVRNFLDPNYIGHPYDSVAWNRKTRQKPLTLEVRLNETHLSIAYYAAIILNRIIRKCYERGFRSPKLLPEVRLDILNRIELKYRESSELRIDLYEALADPDIGPIIFEPGREIPLLKTRYERYFDLFDDIIKKYTPSYPPMARIGRLFLRRGYPAANAKAVWNVFVPFDQFKWDRGPEAR